MSDRGAASSRGVYLDSLGCEKNTVDSESALGMLLAKGYHLVESADDADLLVVNTCGFLATAREESVQRLREVADEKHEGQFLVAMGCLIQGRTHDVQSLVPGVDHCLGVGQYDQLDGLATGALGKLEPGASLLADPSEARYAGYGTRALLGTRHVAHVKLAEGCNQSCTFCKIPVLRGRQRSRPVEEIVVEARALAEQGVSELILIAQNSSAYGIDLPGQPRLGALCRALAAVDGLRWIRIMYAYPPMFTKRLADEIYSVDKVASYLDIPIQHASAGVLARMERGYDPERLRDQLEYLRSLRPDMMLRSTALVGFPGETEDEFVELLDFLAEVRFEHLGTFRYSHEAGTASYKLADDVDAGEKEDRLARVEALQWDLASEQKSSWLGRELEIVVDEQFAPGQAEDLEGVVVEHGADPRAGWSGSPMAFGRSEGFCLEVDGGIWLPGEHLVAGSRLRVQIVGTGPHDFLATSVGRQA